jgi:hypothetical protein
VIKYDPNSDRNQHDTPDDRHSRAETPAQGASAESPDRGHGAGRRPDHFGRDPHLDSESGNTEPDADADRNREGVHREAEGNAEKYEEIHINPRRAGE